jgi:deoxycytidylate deaminase
VLCTHLPCANCAKLLINLGNVVQVFYREDYRIRTSLDLFGRVRIPCIRLLPADGSHVETIAR